MGIFITNTEHLFPHIQYFWTFIRNLKGHNSLPNITVYNIKLINPKEIVNAFAHLFHSCYNTVDITNYVLPTPVTFASSLSKYTFTIEEVIYKINSLDLNKKASLDGNPPILLSKCWEVLSIPLSIIFQKYFV